ncbi:MAG: DUF5698 domain-containing protein [Candidatus Faecisoma sp.]|jgi:uncharacterized protein YebE (UPF0316 family)|nr:DUF5698 domain-containing protein [Acholeplasma sp.]MDY2892315.1 DUF5698 domain-containing protein [Candidatus Faecisoma sp.]CCY27603.1 uPF0316 protein Ftrac_2187 [Acholeplasma sp. CAG:878]
MTYLIIFLLKIVENTIATLRLIIVANGKKLLGAVLNFIMSIVWVISTSLVVQNFKNILNILFFSLGCFVGSYLGSLIETKIGIGSNMLLINSCNSNEIINLLNKNNYKSYITNDNTIMVLVERKKRKNILDLIYKVDSKAIIISYGAHQLLNKHHMENQ